MRDADLKMKNSRISVRETAEIILKSLKLSIHIKTRASIVVSIIGIFAASLPVVISLLLREFTDRIYALSREGGGESGAVLLVFGALSTAYIIQVIFDSTKSYYSSIDTLLIQKYMKRSIIYNSCKVKYKYIENHDNYRNKIEFVDGYAGLRVANSIQQLIVWLQELLTFISIFVVMLNVNPWILVCLMGTSLPSFILSYLQKDEEYKHKTKWMREGAFVIQYFRDCCAQYSLNEVRYFGLFPYIKNKWENMAKMYTCKKRALTTKHVVYNSIADILRNSVYIVVLIITVYEIYCNPQMGIGTIMLVITMSRKLQDVTVSLLGGMARFLGDIPYMADFFELERLEVDPEQSGEFYNRADIKYEHVSFRYPDSNEEALHDINITINQGERVAIVGENGSGKSTFVSLLCSMYAPTSGRITIMGEDMKKNIAKSRASISVVFQDFGKYEMSIKDNITLSLDNTCDNTRLNALCDKVGIMDFIENQPHKSDELIGTFSQHGKNLSGGEWQKIAMARAAYRQNARIMILDEPTSALDPISETKLYENFSALTGNKTTLFISHRLGITKLVDRILVFENGEIVEDGSHRELMKKDGVYKRMYEAQAMWY